MNPPKTLTERHQLLAILIAIGQKKKDAAKALQMSYNRVCTISQSPMFKALVQEHQRLIARRGFDSAVNKLLLDAPENIDFIKEVRDGLFEGADAEHLRIRMSAAGLLLDRQVSKKQETTSTHTETKRFLVEDRRRSEIEQDLEDAGQAIDAEFTRVAPLALPEPALQVRSLDEAIAAYEREEVIDA